MHTAVASPTSSDDTVETGWLDEWLSNAGAKPELSVGAIAEAMQADGFESQEARLLAAAAVLRHDPQPLTTLVQPGRLEEAALCFAQHLRGARQRLLEDTGSTGLMGCDGNVIELAGGHRVQVRFRSRAPEVVLLDGLLSDAECEALINTARTRLGVSQVMGDDAAVVDADVRSSSGTYLTHETHAPVSALEDRFAQLLGCSVTHMEDLAITRYLPGQYFTSHVDYFEEEDGAMHTRELAHAGQRVGTLVVYLTDVPAGGGTAFDIAGFDLRPRRGSAVYFGYRLAGGRMDVASLHQGVPVDSGEKWIATVWLRERAYRRGGVTG